MSKPKKKYRPKPVDPFGGLTLLSAAAQLPKGMLLDLGVAYHAAMAAMVQGRGNEDDANTLATAANVAMMLSERGFGPEYLPDIHAGQQAVVDCMVRHSKHGRWAFDGVGLQAVNRLLEVHDAQLEAEGVSQGLLYRVMQEIRRRKAEGHVLNLEMSA